MMTVLADWDACWLLTMVHSAVAAFIQAVLRMCDHSLFYSGALARTGAHGPLASCLYCTAASWLVHTAERPKYGTRKHIYVFAVRRKPHRAAELRFLGSAHACARCRRAVCCARRRAHIYMCYICGAAAHAGALRAPVRSADRG